MGLHRNEPVFVQNFPVIVQLPSINPAGEEEHGYVSLFAGNSPPTVQMASHLNMLETHTS